MTDDWRSGENAYLDIKMILGHVPRWIIDIGAHNGESAEIYLNAYPGSTLLGIEASCENAEAARRRLAAFGDRAEILQAAAGETEGEAALLLNSHDQTHSLLPIGEQRYWGGFAATTGAETVQTVTLDALLASNAVDLVHMDVQGSELAVLRGARNALADGRIAVLYTEVEFYPLYAGQALFWEIGAFLDSFGYKLFGLYSRFQHPNNRSVVSWADALFVSPRLLEVAEHNRDGA